MRTERRRTRQIAHNLALGITPRSIVKQVRDLIDGVYSEKRVKKPSASTTPPCQRARVET